VRWPPTAGGTPVAAGAPRSRAAPPPRSTSTRRAARAGRLRQLLREPAPAAALRWLLCAQRAASRAARAAAAALKLSPRRRAGSARGGGASGGVRGERVRSARGEEARRARSCGGCGAQETRRGLASKTGACNGSARVAWPAGWRGRDRPLRSRSPQAARAAQRRPRHAARARPRRPRAAPAQQHAAQKAGCEEGAPWPTPGARIAAPRAGEARRQRAGASACRSAKWAAVTGGRFSGLALGLLACSAFLTPLRVARARRRAPTQRTLLPTSPWRLRPRRRPLPPPRRAPQRLRLRRTQTALHSRASSEKPRSASSGGCRTKSPRRRVTPHTQRRCGFTPPLFLFP